MREYYDKLRALPIGSTYSTYHNPCKAVPGGGKDTKARLRFTRTERALVLYYCHHCGTKGKIRLRGSGTAADPPTEPAKAYTPGGHSVMALFPQKAQDWLSQAHITGAYDKGIVWNDTQQRLILPCYSRQGEVLGYQARGFGVSPKYVTKAYGKGAQLYSWKGSCDTVVICEDILSSWRLYEAGYTGVALLRTTLSKVLLLELLQAAPSLVVVWLDNDNPTVNRLARRIVHTLQGYGVEVVRIADRFDPKHYTDKELKQIISEVV